ncbi:sensor histidine kinase [Aeromicrobium sp.]
MQPVDFQPPLSLWSHTWRYAVVLIISATAWSSYAPWQWDHYRAWFFVDLGLGLACMVLVYWRRRFPVTVAVLTALASGISATAAGPSTLALVSLSTRRRRNEIIPVAVLAFCSILLINELSPGSTNGRIVAYTALASLIGVTIGWGLYIGSRRELLATLRDRADRAESEQSRRVEQARTAERGRIAREMHDVLAHRISLVSMHAGALTFRADLTPEEIRNTAGVIQENSHQALTELREVLGVLREGPGDAAPELPQPSAHDIPALVSESREAGMKVDFVENSDLDGLPDNIGRTLYRIVQEGLTNARKHAPDTLVTIAITGSPGDGVTATISNPLRIGDSRLKTPDSGLGLIGLGERSVLSGGRLSHHITPDRVFVLHAWLPWPV